MVDETVDKAAPMASRGRLSWVLRVGFTNLPFALALAAMPHLPQVLQVLVVGATMFLSPGLAWSDRRAGDAFVVLFRAVIASLIIGLIAWLALMPLPGPTSREAFILVLAAAANLGLVVGYRRGWWSADPFGAPLARLLLIPAAAFFLLAYAGAAHFVPALEDQDMETQGTAYGLIHEGVPTMTTNRGTRHFFAHPLLLHFWIGESALIFDELDDLKYYHEHSLAMRGTPEAQRWERFNAQWEKDFAQFEAQPVLTPTRTPNIFLSAFIVFAMGFLTYRLSGSRAAALGVCLLYATLPEVYVRSSYGGYMAVTNFLLVSGAYFYLRSAGLLPDAGAGDISTSRARRLSFFTPFLCALSDQKGILLAMAAPAHAGVRFLLDGGLKRALGTLKDFGGTLKSVLARPDVGTAVIVGVGYGVGQLSYMIYGLSLAPLEFFDEHIRGHLVGRLNVARSLTQDNNFYPNIPELWMEFGDHTGWIFLAVGVAAMVRGARRIREADGLFFIWVAIATIGFSLVDWRHTKHLAHMLPPLMILIAMFWASCSGWTKRLLSVALAGAVAWNIYRIGLLMQDFTYISPKPLW